METMSCGSSLKHLQEAAEGSRPRCWRPKFFIQRAAALLVGLWANLVIVVVFLFFFFNGKTELKAPNTDLVRTFVGQATITLLEPVLSLQPGSNAANPGCSRAPHSAATQKVVICRGRTGHPTSHPNHSNPAAKAPVGTGSQAQRQPQGYNLYSPNTQVHGNPCCWYKTSSHKELTEEGDEQIYDKQKAGGTYGWRDINKTFGRLNVLSLLSALGDGAENKEGCAEPRVYQNVSHIHTELTAC